jgi:hypothetical protein
LHKRVLLYGVCLEDQVLAEVARRVSGALGAQGNLLYN